MSKEKDIKLLAAILNGQYPNTQAGLKRFIEVSSEKSLINLESWLRDARAFGSFDRMEKMLEGANLYGLKPDAYILVRNGRLSVEYSYHFLKKLVLKKYEINIEAHIFDDKDFATITRIDPILRQVDLNIEQYTQAQLNKECFLLENIKGVLVVANGKENVKSWFFRIKDLLNASSTMTGESFLTSAPTKDHYGKPLSQSALKASIHKNLSMIKKTAVRCYIRDFFADLDSIEIEEDYYQNGKEEHEDNPSFEDISEICERMKSAETEEEMDQITQELKKLSITPEDRAKLAGIFKAFKAKKAASAEGSE